MKAALLLFPLFIGSCAPKAIVLIDGATAGSAPAMASNSETSSSESGSGGSTGSKPRTASNGIGLLDPNLTNLPDEREMRPTVSTNDGNPVIAEPPGTNE